MDEYGIWIDNDESSARSGEWFDSVEPATGRPWCSVASGTVQDVDRAVASAVQASRPGSVWHDASPTTRRRILLEAAGVIRDHRDSLAEIESRDAGKLLRETSLHVDACVDWLEYFAGMTDKNLGETIPTERTVLNYTQPQPYGVVGAIVPGNSPLLLTMWKLAPALAAGNAVVIKPSEATTASLITLMRLWRRVIPDGVVNVIPGLGATAGRRIVEHPDVRKVAFTGGTQGGTAVASGAASRLAPSLLELGGKSANIVFADASYEKALAGVMAGVFAASGQTCMAGARVLVEESLYPRFLEDLITRTASITVGHPADEKTDVGPVGSLLQLERIEYFVNSAQSAGAVVEAGGGRASVPESPDGFYFQPTVLTDVPPDAEINRCEVFGPVLTIAPFRSENEALQVANDSDFGLVAGVWTSDLTRGQRFGRDLDVGTVFVNLYRKVMPQSPFGGRGDSGFGRENGFEVMREYTQVKSVLMDLDDAHVQDPFLMRVGNGPHNAG